MQKFKFRRLLLLINPLVALMPAIILAAHVGLSDKVLYYFIFLALFLGASVVQALAVKNPPTAIVFGLVKNFIAFFALFFFLLVCDDTLISGPLFYLYRVLSMLAMATVLASIFLERKILD